ncbi:MAG: LacI family DNA-binding transcriptional regulator, partial [Eubacterium sp.]|nr:LacI family DNA-binding transcriptional regulator [Eubacterium sp.]
GVSEATRKRVLKAAESIGYVGKKTYTESRQLRYVIFIDSGDVINYATFNTIALGSIQERAKQLGYNILISFFYSSEDWKSQIEELSQNCEGIICLGTELDEKHIEKFKSMGIKELNIPLIVIDNDMRHRVNIDTISSDNYFGIYNSVLTLCRNGYTDIGYISADIRINNFELRKSGFQSAYREILGREPDPASYIRLSTDSEQAYVEAVSRLKAGARPCSAYICENDFLAAAAIRALKTFHYRIPEDVSIIGYDDSSICTIADPPITSVRIMNEIIGSTAVDLLMKRIKEGGYNLSDDRKGVSHVVIASELIKRESAKID